MGCSVSKEQCESVYHEMLKRLGVNPLRVVDDGLIASHAAEFNKIALQGGSEDTITIDQLRKHSADCWKLNTIHSYNDVLLAHAVEDVARGLTAPPVSDCAYLKCCDFYPWLLYMCEFYNVMSVFEHRKLLPSNKWDAVAVTEQEVATCLNTLANKFQKAFASDRGPGRAFRSPSSVSASAVIAEVLQWSSHSSKNPKNGHATGQSSVSVITFVRWVVIRHIASTCPNWGIKPKVVDTSKSTSEPATAPEEPLERPENEVFRRKHDLIKCTLGDHTKMEELFVSMTHGTRRLFLEDSVSSCFTSFAMQELFVEPSAHHALVEAAFHVVTKDQRREDAVIFDVKIFYAFLEAYVEALELYHRAVMNESLGVVVPSYGIPIVGLSKGALSHVLMNMEAVEGGGGSDCVCRVLEYLFPSCDENVVGDGQVLFTEVVDSWLSLRFVRDENYPLKDVNELYHDLGFADVMGQQRIRSLLISGSWEPNDATEMFELVQRAIGLSDCCCLYGVLYHCSLDHWVAEYKYRSIAIPTHDAEHSEAVPNHTVRVGCLEEVQAMRLVAGLYATVVAVRELDSTPLPLENACLVQRKRALWNAYTPLSCELFDRLSRAICEVLDMPILSVKCVGVEDPKEEGEGELANTVLMLVRSTVQCFVDRQLSKLYGSALKSLLSLWPLQEDDEKRLVVYSILTQHGPQEDVPISQETLESIDGGQFNPPANLYEQYGNLLGFFVSLQSFCQQFTNAVRFIKLCGGVSLCPEDIPGIMRYMATYIQVLLLAGAVCYHSARTEESVISLYELDIRCRQAEQRENNAYKSAYGYLSTRQGSAAMVRDMAEHVACAAVHDIPHAVRLRIWKNEVEQRLGVVGDIVNMAVCRGIASIVSEEDGYITQEAIETFIPRFRLWRVLHVDVLKPLLRSGLRDVNTIVQRKDLEDSELHQSDLRFFLLYLHTYIDVLFNTECAVSINENEVTVNEDGDIGLGNLEGISWTDQEKNEISFLLSQNEGARAHFTNECVPSDGAGAEYQRVPTASERAAEAARRVVTKAFGCFLSKPASCRKVISPWDQLRERLPVDDSLEGRMRRKELFELIVTKGRQAISLAELSTAVVDVLQLNDFRKDIQTVLFRSFVATKCLVPEEHSALEIGEMDEKFITKSEFRPLLCYMRSYLELYHMFDELCAQSEDPESKTVTLAGFQASTAKLKQWGIRINNPQEVFSSIDRQCGEKNVMYFAQFAVWASMQHLSPAGYSHDVLED
ncbi:hypothetical protein ERJ75_001230000 [Trypanosoma vivax]|nr:hypothetical protein ERJ75_001230000 [Trypanosoma vivax]